MRAMTTTDPATLDRGVFLSELNLRDSELIVFQQENAGRIVVLRRDDAHGDAVLGVFVRDDTGVYLGCLDCTGRIELIDMGMCLDCRDDLAYWEVREQEAASV